MIKKPNGIQYAEEKGLIVVDWNKLSDKQKLTIKDNPKLFMIILNYL